MNVDTRSWLQTSTRREPPVRAEPPREDPLLAQEETKAEDVHPSRAYGGIWSRRDKAHTVEFRFLNPDRADETFDYSWLPRVQWRKQEGMIVLHYEALGVKVSIRGTNLWELKERIRQHLVTWVQEQGNHPLAVRHAQEAAEEEGKDFVFVEEIRLEEADPDKRDR
jgi:hypothetical protein